MKGKRTSIFLLVLMLMFSVISQHCFAMENEIVPLKKAMTTLEGIYKQYSDRHRVPLSLPSAIVNQYQILVTTPAPSNNDISSFLNEIQQHITDFEKAEKVASITNDIWDRLERCLLMFRLKPDTPANIKAIDATLSELIESDTLTGAKFLAFETRYQTAFVAYTKGVFEVCEAHGTIDALGWELDIMLGQLTKTKKATFNKESKDYRTARDEAEYLIKQKQWAAANEKLQQVIALGTEFSIKIKTTLDSFQEEKEANLARHASIIKELEALEPKINRFDKKIKNYIADLEDLCSRTIVDYSCADRCPDLRQRDAIFGHFKNVPNYQCLSKCNNAESEKQASVEREERICINQKRRIQSKAQNSVSERDRLLDQYNRRLKELRTIESALNNE